MDLLFDRLEGGWGLGVAAFVLGALVGSFLNVVIARLPRGESIAYPGSRCPSCGAPIRPHHNVPLLSWLLLRGRCASCRAPISPRYPLVEILTALLFAACAARFGPTLAFLAGSAFVAALVAITFIDLDIFEIPDEISLPGLALGVALRPAVFGAPWWSGLVGAVLGAAFLLFVRWLYFALRGTEAMGLGDVKLIALIGAFLGPGALLPTVTLGSLVGSIAGLLLLGLDRRQGGFGRPEASDAPAAVRTGGPDDDATLLSGAAPSEPLDAAEPEAWARPPARLRFGLVARAFGRRWVLGVPPDMAGRTNVRLGLVAGARGRRGRSGLELVLGLYQDVRGWGHFEGMKLGWPLGLWAGPLVGARTPDVEPAGDGDPWQPPPTAVPFGPFLGLGAIATLLLSPLFARWGLPFGT